MEINQELIVQVGNVAHGGFTVARWEEKVIFVRRALPGETAKMKILKLAPGGKAWIAEVLEVITASKHRIEPKCEYFRFSGCGGCDFQHAEIDYQLKLKETVLVEQFERLAQFDIKNILKTHQLEPKDYFWRSKLRLSPNSEGRLGFRKFRSHEIIPINNCSIAKKEINELLLQASTNKFNSEQILVSDKNSAHIINKRDKRRIESEVLGSKFLHPLGSFWQSHAQMATKLGSLMLDKVDYEETVLDLFAGVGVFGKLLLENKKCESLISLELDKEAAACAKLNLEKYPKARSIMDRAERFLTQTKLRFDLVILDPPRKGLGIGATEKLAKIAKSKIIYVACDPASLARDSKVLFQAGWRLSQLDLIDAFPQTHHFETVAVFSSEA